MINPYLNQAQNKLTPIFSPREWEVMCLMAHKGLSRTGIGNRLNLKMTTINTHFNNIYQKLDIQNRDDDICRAAVVTKAVFDIEEFGCCFY